MKKLTFINIILLIALSSALCLAQAQFPREYVPPEQICSLNGQLDFQDAINILSEYSIQFAGKPIFDPTKQKGPIGIDISAQQWEKAFQVILSSRGLWYDEMEHFFQIGLPAAVSTISGGSDNSQIGSDIKIHPGSREIKIETMFFEGDRKAISEIGVDWSTFYNGKVDIAADQVGALSVNETFLNMTVKVPSKTFNVDVKALLNVFDSRNIGKVLAQPQVVVTESNEGQIQVGQDFSIKTRDFAGNIIDRFFSTGTILQVTPYIITDKEKGDIILIKAHVERSNAAPDVISTIINKSQANSYIQLFDGEETIIAGLYNTEKQSLRKGIPFLKDLPAWFFGLKYLFGYNREETSQKELIIIIKASILPDVFTRKNLPVNNNYFDLDAERKMDRLKQGLPSTIPSKREVKAEYVPQSSRSNTNNNYTAAPVLNTNTIEKNSYKPQPSAEPQIQVTRSENSQLQQSYFIGNIVSNEDNIVLIKWEKEFNTTRLEGKNFSVVRLDANSKPVQIGFIEIQQTKYNRTIAKVIKGSILPGDKVIVKINS